MTIAEILAGESKNVEFKVRRPAKSIKYMKSVVAFANGKGGRIVFGIDDGTRAVVGIPEENVFPEMDAITNAISDSCEPTIVPDVYPQTIEGKTVIIAEISAGKQKPYYIKADGITDGVYMRVSGTSRKADRAMTQEMYYESEGRSYDTVMRRDLAVSDAEVRRLCADMKEVALANCKNDVQRAAVKDVTKNILLSWGILAEDEAGRLHPTNAWVFLNGEDPFLSKIQCGMFKGTTRAVFVDKRDYGGPLWEQVEEAFRFVLRNIRLGAKIEGVYRKDIYELPPDSVRELIVNSVVNCSFLQSSHIQVAVYDDRLEITSPGGLLPGVTIGRMKEGYSQIRNRALAHAFSYMNLIEGWGTGIPRLMREMEEYGLAEPEFIDMEIALRVNLYRADLAARNGTLWASGDTRESDIGNATSMRAGQETSQENAKTTETGQETGQENVKANENVQETNQENAEYNEVIQKTVQNNTVDQENNQDLRPVRDSRNRIIHEIMKNPSVTQIKLGEKTGLSRSGVRYIMKQLQKEGILERVGSTKKGQWILKK